MLKIGTRGSHLATTQAGHVRDALIANGAEAELHIVTTAGGDWLGTLAASPTPDADGLTAQVPLTDTADLWGTVYFVKK